MEIINVLKGEPAISGMIADGTLAVLNIYIDEDLQGWRDYMPVYPEQWYNGFDPDAQRSEDEITVQRSEGDVTTKGSEGDVTILKSEGAVNAQRSEAEVIAHSSEGGVTAQSSESDVSTQRSEHGFMPRDQRWDLPRDQRAESLSRD